MVSTDLSSRQPSCIWCPAAADVDIVVELGDPFDAVERHAVFVLQDAAHPQHGGGHQRLDADLAAFQVGGLGDALAGVDEHEAVAEAAMQEHRDGAERPVIVARRQIRRDRDLGHVEFVVAQEAPMARRRIHVGQDGEVDAVDLHLAARSRGGRFRNRRRPK